MGSLGERLATRRRRCFEGRLAEQELFRTALSANEPPCAVLHVHGPGGIGKTGLLDVFATLADAAGARVVRLDGRDIVPSPPSLLATLRASLDVPDDEPPISSAGVSWYWWTRTSASLRWTTGCERASFRVFRRMR